jgi:hypothetical protein
MANRYWVGGTGTWNASSTTNWSDTSGGSSGASVPVAGDTAIFDQAATYTVTLSYAAALSIDGIQNTAGTVTFAGSVAGGGITLQSLTLTTTAIWDSTTALIFDGTGSYTLDTNGVALACGVQINNVNGAWALASNFALRAGLIFDLTSGALLLGSSTITATRFFSANTNTRTLAFGTGKIVINSNGVAIVVSINATNLTTSGSKRLDISRPSTTCTVNTGMTDLNVFVTSGFYGLTLGSVASSIGSLNFTGFTGQVTFGSALQIKGDIVLGAGMSTGSFATVLTLGGTGVRTITSNGVEFRAPVTVNTTDGTWQLLDAMSVGTSLGRALALTSGTLDLNNQTIAAGAFTSSGSATRALAMGTGKLSTSGNFTLSDTVSSFSITGTGTIEFTGAAARTLSGLGYQAFPVVTHIGTGQLTITGSNKFTSLSVTPTTGNTLLFEGGSLNEFTLSFSMSGAAGTLATLGSTTTTQTVLRRPAIWRVGANSVDAGNNSGLTFADGGGIDYLTISNIAATNDGWVLINDSQTANWQNASNAQTSNWQNASNAQTPDWQNIIDTQTPNWQNIIDAQSPGWTPTNQ